MKLDDFSEIHGHFSRIECYVRQSNTRLLVSNARIVSLENFYCITFASVNLGNGCVKVRLRLLLCDASPQSSVITKNSQVCDVFIKCDQSIKFAFNINLRLNVHYAHELSIERIHARSHTKTQCQSTQQYFCFFAFI